MDVGDGKVVGKWSLAGWAVAHKAPLFLGDDLVDSRSEATTYSGDGTLMNREVGTPGFYVLLEDPHDWLDSWLLNGADLHTNRK